MKKLKEFSETFDLRIENNNLLKKLSDFMFWCGLLLLFSSVYWKEDVERHLSSYLGFSQLTSALVATSIPLIIGFLSAYIRFRNSTIVKKGIGKVP